MAIGLPPAFSLKNVTNQHLVHRLPGFSGI